MFSKNRTIAVLLFLTAILLAACSQPVSPHQINPVDSGAVEVLVPPMDGLTTREETLSEVEQRLFSVDDGEVDIVGEELTFTEEPIEEAHLTQLDVQTVAVQHEIESVSASQPFEELISVEQALAELQTAEELMVQMQELRDQVDYEISVASVCDDEFFEVTIDGVDWTMDEAYDVYRDARVAWRAAQARLERALERDLAASDFGN